MAHAKRTTVPEARLPRGLQFPTPLDFVPSALCTVCRSRVRRWQRLRTSPESEDQGVSARLESRPLPLPLPKRHLHQTMQNNICVQSRRHVLDVIQIVLQRLPRVAQPPAVIAVELAPTQDARAHGMPLPI